MAAQPPLVTAASLLAQRQGRGRELARSRSGFRCGVGEGRAGRWGSVAVRGPRRRSCTRELGATASGARRSAEPALGLWERGGAEDRRVGRGLGGEGALARGGSARFGCVCARASSGLGGRAQGWRDSCPPRRPGLRRVGDPTHAAPGLLLPARGKATEQDYAF